MVLCVSKITWTEGGKADDGTILPSVPELEVTDGWYRLCAKVDEPLARAIRHKVIRVGRKIAVVGARVRIPRLYAVSLDPWAFSCRHLKKIRLKFWKHTILSR
jgi:BRCA2, oligonucleotide/oligosaccharide-binding, domain 1